MRLGWWKLILGDAFVFCNSGEEEKTAVPLATLFSFSCRRACCGSRIRKVRLESAHNPRMNEKAPATPVELQRALHPLLVVA